MGRSAYLHVSAIFLGAGETDVFGKEAAPVTPKGALPPARPPGEGGSLLGYRNSETRDTR